MRWIAYILLAIFAFAALGGCAAKADEPSGFKNDKPQPVEDGGGAAK